LPDADYLRYKSQVRWRFIAIIRAFPRDAQILILDDSTSALSASAEFEIFKQYHQLTKDRTAILISHRLSTVRMVDILMKNEK